LAVTKAFFDAIWPGLVHWVENLGARESKAGDRRAQGRHTAGV